MFKAIEKNLPHLTLKAANMDYYSTYITLAIKKQDREDGSRRQNIIKQQCEGRNSSKQVDVKL